MFQIWSDKVKEFECRIMVEGATLNNTKARLVLEGNQHKVLYEGKIDSKGWFTVQINPTKNLFEGGETGKVVLEVIADDTYFTPWESDFEVTAEKKVTVEMVERDKPTISNKPQVSAVVETEINTKKLQEKKVTISDVSEKLYEYLVEHEVNKRNVRTRPKKVTSLVEQFMRRYRFGDKSGKEIITKALGKIQR